MLKNFEYFGKPITKLSKKEINLIMKVQIHMCNAEKQYMYEKIREDIEECIIKNMVFDDDYINQNHAYLVEVIKQNNFGKDEAGYQKYASNIIEMLFRVELIKRSDLWIKMSTLKHKDFKLNGGVFRDSIYFKKAKV